MDTQESLIEYPCRFPLKIMGAMQDNFAQIIAEIVVRHAPDFDMATMELRPSRNGNYISLTCVINAVSREQLDGLYLEISRHPLVKYML